VKTIDYIKAVRRGSRDAELSFENGWKSVNKIFKSKKTYSRKKKHPKKFGF
jgi:hypothetical protein